MDLLKIGAQLFMQKMGAQGSDMDLGSVTSALSGLLPTNNEGDLDLGGIVNQFKGAGLASLAASFLGDGKNDAFSPSQLLGMLGEGKVSQFASQLNLDADSAANGLSGMIPDLIDKQSQGGSLMDLAMGAAKSGLLGKLFGR